MNSARSRPLNMTHVIFALRTQDGKPQPKHEEMVKDLLSEPDYSDRLTEMIAAGSVRLFNSTATAVGWTSQCYARN